MKGDADVIAHLNKILKNEHTAINQYFLHSRMLHNWGLKKLGDYEHHESVDEATQLLLSLVQTLNSTLVLSQVLEQVTDAIMHITGAERGFLLLADGSPPASRYPAVAGLRLRVARGRVEGMAASGQGISAAVVRRALETGEVVSTVRSRAESTDATPPSVRTDDQTSPVQTIVCLPLRSPRAGADGTGAFPRALGVLYVDNAGSALPFSGDGLRAAEALARHAALAIENAQLFEREQHTIEELQKAQKQLLRLKYNTAMIVVTLVSHLTGE